MTKLQHPPVETAGFQVDQGSQHCTNFAMIGDGIKITRILKVTESYQCVCTPLPLPLFALTIRASRAEPDLT